MSGVITTDPFEILDAGKTFYENLYKSKRNNRQQNERYFKFEDLPMPTELCRMSSDKVVRERLVWRNVPKF